MYLNCVHDFETNIYFNRCLNIFLIEIQPHDVNNVVVSFSYLNEYANSRREIENEKKKVLLLRSVITFCFLSFSLIRMPSAEWRTLLTQSRCELSTLQWAIVVMFSTCILNRNSFYILFSAAIGKLCGFMTL